MKSFVSWLEASPEDSGGFLSLWRAQNDPEMINPLFKHCTRCMSYHNALKWDQIPKSKSKITCEVDNLWERDFAKSPVSHLIRKNFQLTFERNPKFFWFFYTLRYDWSEKLAPLSRPIILKTIANLVLISRVSRLETICLFCLLWHWFSILDQKALQSYVGFVQSRMYFLSFIGL